MKILESSYCGVEFNNNSASKINPKILSGFNDNLGSIVNLTYDDEAVLLALDKLHIGALRHPGGDPANCWSFANASYITPCNLPDYDCCLSGNQRIYKYPNQTFSSKHFHDYIGSHLYDQEYRNIVYDLNLLTLYNNDLLNELNILNDQLDGNLMYLEYGNEFYISDQFSWEFTNSTVYIEKALPLLKYAKQLFPDCKRAIVATFGGNNNVDVEKWNQPLAEYGEYFESVTIHDYSLSASQMTNLHDLQDQYSYIMSYGRTSIEYIIENVTKYFSNNSINDINSGNSGSSKSIWITEFNTQIVNDTFSFSVLHGMLALGYVMASVCNHESIEMLLLHDFGEQNSWIDGTGNMYQGITLLPELSNKTDQVSYNVIGQMYAHFNYIALQSNFSQMYCLQTNKTNCPTLDIIVNGKKNLQCITGNGFSNGSIFGVAIMNSCKFGINIDIIIPSASVDTTTTGFNVSYWQYTADMKLTQIFVKFEDCPQNDEIWRCGPATLSEKTIVVQPNQQSFNLTIDPSALMLALGQSS